MELDNGHNTLTKKDINDVVNHPKHYNVGKIEVIDAIRDWDLDFCLGNVIKYVMRWRYKGGLEDLHKAQEYLNILIKNELENSSE